MTVVIELIYLDFAAQGVAVHAEQRRGARLIAACAIEDRLDEAFFKFADGFVELNAVFHHLGH